jgi:superfamily II DNA or RNA helicase
LVPPEIFLYDFKHERKARKGMPYSEIYSNEITNNYERNKLVVDIAMKAIRANKSTLILINYIEHGENLLKILEKVYPEAVFIHGSTEPEKRLNVLKEFKEGTRKLIISSNILGEGVDIPKLDLLITARAEASTIAAYQALGRTLRLSEGKTKALVVDICDSGVKYLESHTNSRISVYAKEPRYKLIPVKGIDEVNFD